MVAGARARQVNCPSGFHASNCRYMTRLATCGHGNVEYNWFRPLSIVITSHWNLLMHIISVIVRSFTYPMLMMTSSNGNIFRVTGHLCGEFTGRGESPAQRPVTGSFDVSLICARINDWVNNREAGDLRRHRGHYDVNVMLTSRSYSRTCRGQMWYHPNDSRWHRFSKILFEIHTFPIKKMQLIMSSGKWRSVCLGANVSISLPIFVMQIIRTVFIDVQLV